MKATEAVRNWRRPARNVEIGTLQDAFLVSAVVMILIIRPALDATADEGERARAAAERLAPA